MKYSLGKRLIALLLCVLISFPAASFGVFAADADYQEEVEKTYVLAGSDFQPDGNNNTLGQTLVSGILSSVTEDYPEMDGFLFAGDYNQNSTSSVSASVNGLEALQGVIESTYGTELHEVYGQGNHDPDSMVADGTLSPSGANDAENYGVFLINEKDYMWNNSDKSTIIKTASALKTYLDEKIIAGYTKPIFIVSHLPLHYSLRTVNDGDGQYANYLFDVINAAAADGLNIVYLFGHDHSHGWDDYLGGSAIYLEKGDEILIGQGSKTEYAEETLNFIYMNPGYVGYYTTNNSAFVADLTMTVFEITDEYLTITRYSDDGVHNLKNSGLAHADGKGTESWSPNTAVIASPQYIKLNTVITDSSLSGDSDSGSGSSKPEVDLNSKAYTRIYSTSEIVSGERYLIVLAGAGYLVLPESVTKDSRTGYDYEESDITGLATEYGSYDAYEWVIESKNGGFVLKDQSGKTSYLQSTSDSSRKSAVFSSSNATTYNISEDNDTFAFIDKNNTSVCWDQSSKGVINGYSKTPDTYFYIYKLSSGTKGWVEITAPVAEVTKTVYQYTKYTGSNPKGKSDFIIVKDGKITDNSSTTLSLKAVDIVDGKIELDSNTYEWDINSSGKVSTKIGNTTRYLYVNSSGEFSLTSSSSSAREWSFSVSNGDYTISTTRSNRTYYFNGTTATTTKNTVELYQYSGTVQKVVTPAQDGEYAKLEGPINFILDPKLSLDEIKAEILKTLVVKVNKTASDTGAYDAMVSDIVLTPVQNNTEEDFTMTVSYEGEELGTINVFLRSEEASDDLVYELVSGEEGTVLSGSTQKSSVKSYIKVIEGDSFRYVPITVGMLSDSEGNIVTTETAGDIENLILTYKGKVLSENFTLHVTNFVGNDYPEYPDGGSVTVDKYADASLLQSTGVVNVELSAAGIPVKTGTDVIVMVDTSSSMNDNKVLDANGNTTTKTRLEALEDSLTALVEKLQQPGPGGETMDVRIAVADFNGYYTSSSDRYTSPVYLSSDDHLSDSTTRSETPVVDVYTGDLNIGLGAFVDVHTIDVGAEDCFTHNLTYHSGTNYDYAFDTVYQLGEAVKTDNAARGEMRDLYVIFMSDGAPFQYNFFSSQSGSNDSTDFLWNNWLQGTIDLNSDAIPEGARADYYNEDGKHWMAEAIKGTGTFNVIRKNDARDTDGDDWIQVEGLGATMYSIGFALKRDKSVTVDSMTMVIRNIASSDDLYFNVNTADELTDAFSQIGTDIIYAATDAYFVDQMGESFNIQLSPVIDTIDNLGNSVQINLEQKFGAAVTTRVLSYNIYTEDQVGHTVEGVYVTAGMVGQSYGSPEVLEIVSCDYSKSDFKQKVPVIVLNSNAIGNASADIYDDATGLITAKYFWYNANKTESCEITLANGSTYTLEPETFYWNIGIIDNKKIALNYYVYLEGSMEGEAAAGSYATNKYATLYYKNWLKNDAHLNTTSPSVGWKSANVSYAFYLVNENGEPIVNQTTGATGSFYNAVKLTKPVVYQEILLNNLEDIDAIEAKSVNVLPDGYELYDPSSAYKVVILSEEGEGSWSITCDASKGNTNYVTGYYGSYASNEERVCSRYDTDHGITEVNGYKIYNEYDYTHTTVWFAVVYEVSAIPDTVVVDYGIPVDVNVIANDMFGESGELCGIGATLPEKNGVYTSQFADTELTFEHGAAKIENGKITYQLTSMSMQSAETIYYEVKHTNVSYDDEGIPTTIVRYYYSTLTIIPATTLYFEETFATFEDSAAKYESMGEWGIIGEYDADAHQDEDRPGENSYNYFDEIDHDNVYGFDSSNTSFNTYSLGSAMKVTVDTVTGALASAPKATFTFTGTGFDLISLTDNDSGVIRVTVYNSAGALKKFLMVDNYYGYSFADGVWTPIDDSELDEDIANNENCIYQVPVIKVNNLNYDTYTAKIEVLYFASSDHRLGEGETEGSYNFVFDSVRVYDPANDAHDDYETIVDAYVKDGEYAPIYRMVKEAILGNDELENISPDMSGTINGAVFIDGIDSTENAGDYSNPGPNNETYLANGQSVTFKLYANEKPASVHIGAKLAFGTEMLLSINGRNAVKLTTATDMYYSIDRYISWVLNSEGIWETEKAITLSSTGDGVISLTNVKMTSEASATFDFGFFVDAQTVSSGLEYSDMLFSDEISFLAGDVDMNGKINVRDIMLMKKASVGKDYGFDIRTCDFDGNGRISAKDILRAKKIVKGTEEPFYLTYKK